MTTEQHATQAKQIVSALRLHSRITHQQFGTTEAHLEELKGSLPFFLPFGGAPCHGIIPILDWDHKLPSKVFVIRLYLYYAPATLRAGEAEIRARSEQIMARDKFPEFDVPDYAGITADEAYEGELEASGKVKEIRLVSGWRRDIETNDAQTAVHLVRQSDEFHKITALIRKRPEYLGDPEAVSWTPPCETTYSAWTIDVWYLTDLNASVGRGRSFLVDLEKQKVVGVREFLVRAG